MIICLILVKFFSILRYKIMGGGLMQLVAYGAQDIYLTGNPQITFFKVVYRRHTNFSIESIKQTFNGTADFGSEVSATISRNGDLVYRMYLEHDATFTHAEAAADAKQLNLVERYGDSLIKECEIEIGGQRIDKHYSLWNRVWSDLTEENPTGFFATSSGSTAQKAGSGSQNAVQGTGTLYQLMTGNHPGYNTGAQSHNANRMGVNASSGGANTADPVNGFLYTRGDETDGGGADTVEKAKIVVNKIFLPLQFWFCRNAGLALPLIALQYHEVKVKMTFENSTNLARAGATADHDAAVPISSSTCTAAGKFDLWCDYIYLDTDERRRFAQVSHEYLIEQLQRSEHVLNIDSPVIDINMNHPVKELIWALRNETVATGALDNGGRHQTPGEKLGDATSGPVSIDRFEGKWQLKLNGHDRFSERESSYFNQTQVWQHHSGFGSIPSFGATVNGDMNENDYTSSVSVGAIGVYSFALKPEEHQPSGTCNFSRIDNAQLCGINTTVAAGGGGSDGGAPTQQKELSSTQANNTLLTLFGVNYNVLRIMSGMGGLAYSN
ncbi:MAG: hypothetical protein CMD29_03260 [Flavobacteriales bacterium]|nr:hypothetical protein [Flavobacteriales bacterium]